MNRAQQQAIFAALAERQRRGPGVGLRRGPITRLHQAAYRLGAQHPFAREVAIGVPAMVAGGLLVSRAQALAPVAGFLARRAALVRGAAKLGINIAGYSAAGGLVKRAAFGTKPFRRSNQADAGFLVGTVLGGGLEWGAGKLVRRRLAKQAVRYLIP